MPIAESGLPVRGRCAGRIGGFDPSDPENRPVFMVFGSSAGIMLAYAAVHYREQKFRKKEDP